MTPSFATAIGAFSVSPRAHFLAAALMVASAQPLLALSWTDWADLSLKSPVVLIATIDKTGKLSRKAAPDVPPGELRTLVEARLTAALKAPGLLPARGEWLWQGPPDTKGRPPFGKGASIIVFAEPVSAGADPDVQQYRLTARDAMQPWSPEAEATVRALLAEAAKPDNRGLMVTRITDGFHSAGTVSGQSESQFFLATESGRTMTLLIERRPETEPTIKLATGDVIDRAAPVEPRTLRWHALACGLPSALPERLAESADLQADFAAARNHLGPCGRTALQGFSR